MSKAIYQNKLNPYLRMFLFVYLFTVLGGALRKWVIASKEIGNMILFLQILVPYTFLLIPKSTTNFKFAKAPLFFLILILIIGLLNPLNLTLNHGLIGFLLHFGFFFLLFFYLNHRNDFQLDRILVYLVAGGLIQLLLVFYQYTEPADSFINTYADVDAVSSIALVGKAVRVTGTFSYISGFTGFLFFHSLLIWAMVKYRYKYIYTFLLIAMGLFACFMSGARAATYLFIIVFLLTMVSEYRSVKEIFLDSKLFIPLVLIGTFVIAIDSERFIGLIENAFSGFIERRNRGLETGEENQRIWADIIELFNFKGNYPILGIGLGSTYQGANQLFGISPYIQEYGFFESELIRIILEGGFLLFITRIVLISYLIGQLMIPRIAKIFFSLIIIFFFPVIFNVYNAVFAALGLMLLDNIYYQQYAFSKQLLTMRKYSQNLMKF